MMPARRSLLAAGSLGLAVATASSFVPLSYDEGNWLAVVRRVSLGEVLYRDIMDNKTPPLFGLVRLLDGLPGPFTLARGIWLGVAVAVIAVACASIVRRFGWGPDRATLVGLAFGLAAATQAVLTLNLELPAVLLIVLGLASIATGRLTAGGALAASAATFDLRTIALIPGVVAFAYVCEGWLRARRTLLAAGAITVAWSATVLLVADLRYPLIELNAATRVGTSAWRPGQQLFAALRGTLIPIGAVVALGGKSRGRPIRVAGLMLGVAAVALAFASLRPFDKYWTLLLPGLVVLAASAPAGIVIPSTGWRRLGSTAFIFGLVVAAAYATSTNVDQARLVARYERAATQLDATLDPGEGFVRFDTQPFLGVFLPERDRLPAAVLDFLIADTSRREEIHRRVEEAIAAATVMADDGALSAGEGSVVISYRPLWRVFAGHLEDFPCVRQVEGLTFRYRATACPAG